MKPKTQPAITESLAAFSSLPDEAFVRMPTVRGLYACSTGTVQRRVKDGLIPAPQKIGGTVVWRVGDLRQALNGDEQ